MYTYAMGQYWVYRRPAAGWLHLDFLIDKRKSMLSYLLRLSTMTAIYITSACKELVCLITLSQIIITEQTIPWQSGRVFARNGHFKCRINKTINNKTYMHRDRILALAWERKLSCYVKDPGQLAQAPPCHLLNWTSVYISYGNSLGPAGACLCPLLPTWFNFNPSMDK